MTDVPGYVSMFTGVGGADLGFDQAGWQCIAQIEWNKDCQAVLAHHWPDVPKWWDVSDVNGGELPAATTVVFGSPCQDLSIAGRREGLGDTRTTVTVVGFSHTQGLDAQPSEDAWPTLRSGGGGHAVATTEPASVTFHTRDGEVQAEMSDPGVATTVRGGGGGSSRPHVVEPRAVVRRLTPTECERLMGWPDHHTRWRADGTELSDSTRYRMCGNGIAAPVAQWLAERLREVSR